MQPDIQAIRATVETIVDGRGQPIDEGIKDVVVGLMYHGFATTASCEGHLDHGSLEPWVRIGLLGIEVERAVGITRRGEKYEYLRPRLSRAYPSDAAIEEGVRNLRRTLTELLDKFYVGRRVPSDVRLDVQPSVWYGVCLTNEGARWWQRFVPFGRPAKLKAYQAEMQAFAEFLLA